MDSKKWLECVAATWAEGHQTGAALGQALKERLNLPSLQMAEALVGAVDELVDYASGDVGDEDVLELEDAAVARSRTVLRGLLEAKLQKRIDGLDSAEKKSPAANVIDLQSRKVDQVENGQANSEK